MPGDWQKDLPLLTPERVREVIERDRAGWLRALPAADAAPRLGFSSRETFTETLGILGAAGDTQTVRRRDDLRRVAEEILTRRWLRVYDHHPDRIERNGPLLGFPVPQYRSPAELVGGSLTYQDALQELWQRDVGDALPALALSAHLFPDLAAACGERMKGIVRASLEFPTWGAWEPYVDMDLSVAHIARGIAIAYDWHRELWTEAERDRVFSVLRQKLGTLLRGAYGAAFWARGWTDNHCQNAFATLGICGACFLGEIPEAEEWLGAAVAGFEIALPLCNADGSSAEGVPYWGYGMSFLLQYIELTRHITRAADTLYEAPYLKNAVKYRLHCSLPDLSGTLTFGDAHLQDYNGPSHLLYALARQYRDGAAQWLGDAIPFANRSGADIEAWTLLWRDPSLLPAAPDVLPVDYHLPAWDVATTRSGWKPTDYVVAVKSGFTNRNHSHLDAGTLLFGWGDEWLIDAPGYGQVGPGFWDTGGPRWDYYSNATESHSTLLINGKNQWFDPAARATITAFESTGEQCRIEVDLTNAYTDALRVRRRVFHRRGQYILVLDDVDFPQNTPNNAPSENRVEWLLQPGKAVLVGGAEGVHGSSVTLQGREGSLLVQALAPPNAIAPSFVPRTPRAPHLDTAPEAVRTLALTAQDTAVQGTAVAAFVVLIVPGSAPNTAQNITAHVEAGEAGCLRVIVQGEEFKDILTARK